MKRVGIRALKQNASAVVADAVAGETITVTDRGRPVAMLSGLAPSRIDQLLAEGRARPPLRDLRSMSLPTETGNISADLIEARDDERY